MEKSVPEVLSKAQGHKPRTETKTEGTVFPNTNQHRSVKNLFIFPQENKTQVLEQIMLQK